MRSWRRSSTCPPAACSQRTKAPRDAAYYFNCHAEVDLNRICEHIIACVEFTLSDNSVSSRRRFEAAGMTLDATRPYRGCSRGRVILSLPFLNNLAWVLSRSTATGKRKAW